MRLIREFLFIIKEQSLGLAILSVFYKVLFKINNSKAVLSRSLLRKNNQRKISDTLLVYNNENKEVNNKRLIDITKNESLSAFLRPYSSDWDVYSQVITNQDYLSVVEIYNQLFGDAPNRIIDCGSNIGLTSIFFSQYYPNAHYTAIEPFKDNAELVRLNFEKNEISKFEIIEGGVWNRETKLLINRTFRDGKQWAISLKESPDGRGDIQTYSLLDIVRSSAEPVDILKIDIEGSEKEIFENNEYASSFLNNVKCLAIEIHDEFDCRVSIYKVLKASNFFYYNIEDMTIAINRKFLS